MAYEIVPRLAPLYVLGEGLGVRRFFHSNKVELIINYGSDFWYIRPGNSTN